MNVGMRIKKHLQELRDDGQKIIQKDIAAELSKQTGKRYNQSDVSRMLKDEFVITVGELRIICTFIKANIRRMISK